MADMEPFTLVEETARPGPHRLFDDVAGLTSGKTADQDLQYIVSLRHNNPGMVVTGIPSYNVPLRVFAASGFATCELDKDTDSFASWRGYASPSLRQNKGSLAESVHFAKYHYQWNNEDFILYIVGNIQYVLKERKSSEHELGPSKATDALIQTVGDWLLSDQQVVWVYDNGYWRRDKQLYNEVQKASWDKVILDEKMKKELTSVASNFFNGKDVYGDLGVPWKRGLMFHGPPGNGKTISIKALMHTLLNRKKPIPTLYVKSAPYTWDIEDVFRQARMLSPCMLILEDVETIVTPDTRSYFFNEMDGLNNNDGLFIVASTNYLNKLDPGLTSRPSRFDRKYLFPLPNQHERELYCEFWRHKLQGMKSTVEFPKLLCPAMAKVTPAFSFAFLQECFVASLLTIARGEGEEAWLDAAELTAYGDDLEQYELWVVFKTQAEILRKEINHEETNPSALTNEYRRALPQQASSSSSSRGGRPRRASQDDKLAKGLERLDVKYEKDENLRPLPMDKRAFINSAAMEFKCPF